MPEYNNCIVCCKIFEIPYNIPKSYNIYTRCTGCFINDLNKNSDIVFGKCKIRLCEEDILGKPL
jgi:hypothetical protein